MKTTYLTLTIGPVTDTLLEQRATREMWAASYLFSYIIRETIRTACDAGAKEMEGTVAIPGDNVLLPVLQADIDGEYTYGAGLYPDRIFIKADDPDNDAKRLNSAVDAVIKKIADETAAQQYDKESDPDFEAHVQFILDYLHDYYRINILQNEQDAQQNIVTTITPYLDASEQYARLLPAEAKEARNPLSALFFNANESFLFKSAFGGKRPEGVERQRGFDSLMEIATRELERLDENRYDEVLRHKDDEQRFIETVKRKFKDEFRAYHKYVAVVHADGDNVGKVIGKVAKDPKQLKAFSNKLRDFALDATKIVYDYGGAPVYMGGDDMLFFAPIACTNSGNKQTIFDLMDDLDRLFNGSLVSYAESVGAHLVEKDGQVLAEPKLLPSLSYGLTISFYKYPLYEAKTASFQEMEGIKAGEKNGIGVKFLKHSGHAINFKLHKHRTATYAAFLELLRRHLPDEASFLNSFTYKLDHQRLLLEKAAAAANPAVLETFFKNNFNEVWGSHGDFFQGLMPLIRAIYAESKPVERSLNPKDAPKHWTQLLYATLRFIHFLKSKDSDDE